MGLLTFSARSFPKPKRWAVEVDYINQLSSAERAWLVKFQSEYHNGIVKKNDHKAFHRKVAMRRDCYQRTNLAMRDLYAILQCQGMLSDNVSAIQGQDIEDRLIEALDAMRPESPSLVARAFAVLDRIMREKNEELAENVQP